MTVRECWASSKFITLSGGLCVSHRRMTKCQHEWILFMTASLDIVFISRCVGRREQNLIVHIGKSEAEVSAFERRPYQATLAGCSWASRLHTQRHGVQLSARSSASVFCGIVPTSRRSRITATSAICHPTARGRTAPPAQLLPTGFLCGWSVSLVFLPHSLWNPVIGGNSFGQSLKMFLFATYWCIQRIIEVSRRCAI